MKQYYVAESASSPKGPFDEEMVKQAHARRMYPVGTRVWRAGMSDWMNIEAVFGTPQAESCAPVSADGEPEQYFLAEPGREAHGPHPLAEVLKGSYPEGTQVWSRALKAWMPLREFRKASAPAGASAVPPVPPPPPAAAAADATWNPINAVTSNFKRYMQFAGRSGRAEFWFFQLALVVLGLPSYIGGEEMLAWDVVTDIAFLFPGMALYCRRLQDIGYKGYIAASLSVASDLWGLCLTAAGDAAAEELMLPTLLILLPCIILGLIPGQKGSNPYGDKPLSPR